MEILVAEGTESLRETLREVSEVLGHRPVDAANTSEVWEILTAHYPEIALVVMSWDLPGPGGGDVIRRILADRRFGRIPIMVLFGENETAQAIEAFQAGAMECVSRVATRQDLVTRMLDCLGRAA